MQPYFLPYVGYFQLMHAVDIFVLYDDVKYTKKGWINRNRILTAQGIEYFSIPLKKASDYLTIKEREVADDFSVQKMNVLNKVRNEYRKAPFFTEAFEIFNQVLNLEEKNLFNFLFAGLEVVKGKLDFQTPMLVSSQLAISKEARFKEKIIEICKQLNATQYINLPGGMELYDRSDFDKHNIDLCFIKTKEFMYDQGSADFYPHLSILDVLMNVGIDETNRIIQEEYALIPGK